MSAEWRRRSVSSSRDSQIKTREPKMSVQALVRRVWNWPRLPLALIAIGALWRLFYAVFLHSGEAGGGEAFNAAKAFAETGTIGDTYQPGQGPSAHLLPIPTLIAGSIYRLFGVGSAPAELILAALATMLVLVTFWALYRTFEELDVPRAVRLGALSFLCLVPLNVQIETMALRVWDNGYATALSSLVLLGIVRAHRAERPSRTMVVALGLVAALLFFINPQMGLAAVCCGILLTVRRLPAADWWKVGAASALALAALVIPWTIRNERSLGEPILLRSNAGLQVAVGFHEGLNGPGSDREIFLKRYTSVHPRMSVAAYRRMQQVGGEAAYSRILGAEARQWIKNNPGTAAVAAGKHVLQILFPPPWFWERFSDPGAASKLKAAFAGLVSIFAIVGMAWAIRRRRGFEYPLIMFAVPALTFAMVQPTLRYRYLLFALIVNFAAVGAASLVRALATNRSA